jgi:nicotinamide-nucleotide amidase
MKAEVISIGTELVTGQCLDTNSQWLSRRLAALGIPVRFHTTLADDLDENVAAFRVAAGRADLVVLSGGLGPTQDDLTRDALAALAGVELVLHEPSLDHIRNLFATRGREMPERNRVQALFPAGAEPIPNERGTAPGIWMEVKREEKSVESEERSTSTSRSILFIALPGVPGEMMHLFTNLVQPRLAARCGGGRVLVERKINCFGAGESAVEAKLLDLTRRGHVPEVGITVSDTIISLRILGEAATVEDAQERIAPVEAIIRERLGDLVFGTDGDELHHVVARLLLEKKQTVAIAESLTGGLVTQLLSRVPGVSASLLGAVVAYANEAKVKLLGVPADVLAAHGAVSAEVAEAMATGARSRFSSDLAVSTTGIAGPGGATATKPVGLVYIGLSWAGGVQSFPVNWFGSREEIQSRSAKSALNAVRLHLLRI